MTRRIERARLSIAAGNAVQGVMLAGGVATLALSMSGVAIAFRIAGMIAGYLLIYFSVHAAAHWLVGRLVGIRFTHYSIGGTTHAAAYPPGMRQLFVRLPFFAVHVDSASLRAASPIAQAMMFGAGMTSSVLGCTLAATWCAIGGAPGGVALLVVNTVWFAGALIAETRTCGDYTKAAQALAARHQGR
ncbi:MAG: hypothetical protein KatS3mg052_0439 [Candidatus Roseilinea sp.]|nr:MAG: hypothetical protein KatS3mg052_0439 [Candidatus Roseilinea sp.]